MSIQAEPKLKTKHDPDLDIRLPHSVEECSARLEALADSDPALAVDVALLAHDGAWDVELTHSDTNIVLPDYTRVRFVGALRRTPMGGTALSGRFLLDRATFMTRGLWLTITGPLLILIMLRLGFRVPLLGLLCLMALGWLIYMMVNQPDKVLAQRRQMLTERIDEALR